MTAGNYNGGNKLHAAFSKTKLIIMNSKNVRSEKREEIIAMKS
jgi:hypothetical protein